MTNDLQIFSFKGNEVRTVTINDEPYFVGKDVADILGYSNPSATISKNVADKFKGVAEMETPGGKQKLVVISEAGLYKLCFKSHAQFAEQRVNELTPKTSYYDLVLQNKALVTITQIAKDYGMSGQELNRKLHELGVIYRQGKTWLLYSKYQQTGWTQSETFMAPKPGGTQKAVMHTKWTQKGRLGLYELLKQNGILPLIEIEDED